MTAKKEAPLKIFSKMDLARFLESISNEKFIQIRKYSKRTRTNKIIDFLYEYEDFEKDDLKIKFGRGPNIKGPIAEKISKVLNFNLTELKNLQ